MTRNLDISLIAVIACLMAVMCLMFAGPQFMNADTPLLTVMSLQRLTLFIWGQNRFLNIVPALASPIRNPDANLILQMMMFGGGFFGLLAVFGWLMAGLVLRTGRRLDVWLCFSVLVFLFLAVASRFAIHVFVSEGQPYGLSGLLMALGLIPMLRPAGASWYGRAIAFLAMLIAGGLNPSLIIATSGVCVAAFFGWPSTRRQTLVAFVLSGFASAVWLVIGYLVPGRSGYGSFKHTHLLPDLVETWRVMRSEIAWGALALAALVSVLAAVAVQSQRQQPAGIGKPRWALVYCCVLFAAAWVLLFSQNKWVIANGWHFRYFYPALFALLLLLAAPLAALAIRFGTSVRLTLTVALLLSSVALVASPWHRFDGFPMFAAAKRFADQAKAQNVHLIAGSYWRVWPTVFLMQRDGDAFGIDGERDIGNQDHLIEALQRMEASGVLPQSLCVDAEPEQCLALAASITGRLWRAVAGQCGNHCSLIEMPPARPYALGEVEDMTAAIGSRRFLGYGWAPAEAWGTWAIGGRTQIFVPLASPPDRDLVFKADMHAFGDGAGDAVKKTAVFVNGQFLTDLVAPDSAEREISFVIPRSVAAARPTMMIEFRFLQPKSPADLGVGDDPRQLTWGFTRFVVSAFP